MRGNLKIIENKELKERFIAEKTRIEYVRQGDYYMPNLALSKQKKIHLNKYYTKIALSCTLKACVRLNSIYCLQNCI